MSTEPRGSGGLRQAKKGGMEAGNGMWCGGSTGRVAEGEPGGKTVANVKLQVATLTFTR